MGGMNIKNQDNTTRKRYNRLSFVYDFVEMCPWSIQAPNNREKGLGIELRNTEGKYWKLG